MHSRQQARYHHLRCSFSSPYSKLPIERKFQIIGISGKPQKNTHTESGKKDKNRIYAADQTSNLFEMQC